MTTKRDLGPRLSARLTYQLKRALVDLEDLHAEHLAPVGVSGRELGVLLLLDGQNPESQQQVAARLRVDRTTMVALLDGLEAKGLVTYLLRRKAITQDHWSPQPVRHRLSRTPRRRLASSSGPGTDRRRSTTQRP